MCTSPVALWPKRKSSPTTTAAACSFSTSTVRTNSSGSIRENSRVNGSTHTASAPRPASSSVRRLAEHRNGGWLPGLVTSSGCGSKVTATDGQPALSPDLGRPRDDALMPAVHAIEHADRDDGFAPSCGDLVQALPAVHDFAALLRSAPSLAIARPRPTAAAGATRRHRTRAESARPSGSLAPSAASAVRPSPRIRARAIEAFGANHRDPIEARPAPERLARAASGRARRNQSDALPRARPSGSLAPSAASNVAYGANDPPLSRPLAPTTQRPSRRDPSPGAAARARPGAAVPPGRPAGGGARAGPGVAGLGRGRRLAGEDGEGPQLARLAP